MLHVLYKKWENDSLSLNANSLAMSGSMFVRLGRLVNHRQTVRMKDDLR